MDFQISLCKFHKNSLSERLLEGKAVTLSDEITEDKAVSILLINLTQLQLSPPEAFL